MPLVLMQLSSLVTSCGSCSGSTQPVDSFCNHISVRTLGVEGGSLLQGLQQHLISSSVISGSRLLSSVRTWFAVAVQTLRPVADRIGALLAAVVVRLSAAATDI